MRSNPLRKRLTSGSLDQGRRPSARTSRAKWWNVGLNDIWEIRSELLDRSQHSVLIARLQACEAKDRLGETVVRGEQISRRHPQLPRHLLDRLNVCLVHSLLVPVDAGGGDIFFQPDTHTQFGLRVSGSKPCRLKPAGEMLRRK